MHEAFPFLLNNHKKSKIYNHFLTAEQNQFTVQKLADLGERLMRKENLHHHFFGDFSLYAVALYLTLFSLNLPYDPYQFRKDNFFKFSKKSQDHPYLSIRLSQDKVLEIILLFEKIISEKIPVEYMTNEAFYMGNTFYVNEHVLVPRSIMNMRFKDFLGSTAWENYRVLDLCTGSGCIGITLSLLQPNIRVDLADISSLALDVAQINIERFDLQERVRCIKSDLFDSIQERYDLIITNPPYVSTHDYNQSPIEFKKEPKIALEAGSDGLDIIHRILKEAKAYLNPQGMLIAEVGSASAKKVKKQYSTIPFKWYKYRRPNGKESFFDDHGVFQCEAKYLP